MNKDNSTYVFSEPSSHNNSNFISTFTWPFFSPLKLTLTTNIFIENENVLRCAGYHNVSNSSDGPPVLKCLNDKSTRSRCALGN